MEGIGSTIGVFKVVLPAKLAIRGELNPTVIQESSFADLAAVHEPGEVGVPQRLLVKEVVPEVVRLGLAAEDNCHHIGQCISQVSVRLICINHSLYSFIKQQTLTTTSVGTASVCVWHKKTW